MCGIIGIASMEKQENRSWLVNGRDAMLHRGPDDAGVWWSDNGQVGLAQRRLAVVDLSPMGHQPMVANELGLSITFNGEIYNFRELQTQLKQFGYVFRSASDTEVLLAAYHKWGPDCLEKLNGMFALAIYDIKKNLMFFARDRAGEKPFFYHLNQGSFYFASELKALLAHPALPRKINHQALDCYLAVGYVPGDRCILEGYRKLPPAHAIIFDLTTGQLKTWRYWELPAMPVQANPTGVDELTLLDELETLLEGAVKKQMVADVPVGVLLSGGVDSSLITAMAVRTSSKVKTFTVGFAGHGAMDETHHARLIANHFSTDHTELQADSVTPDLLFRLARQYDEPINDSSMIPTFLVSQLVRQHCTVALGGDGGDELFGGYEHYSRLLWLKDTLGAIPYPLRKLFAMATQAVLPLGYKGRNWAQALGTNFKSELPLLATYFDSKTRAKLIDGFTYQYQSAEQIMAQRVPHTTNLLDRATRMDFNNYLAEDILVKVDRASMLNSLEMRAPFLDTQLINFAFARVPSSLKTTSNEKKILLKRLTKRVLPLNFDRQRKQGFSIPLASWLKGGSFREMFKQVLLDTNSSLNRATVINLFEGQDQGRNNSERLFGLVLLELWRREYGINY